MDEKFKQDESGADLAPVLPPIISPTEVKTENKLLISYQETRSRVEIIQKNLLLTISPSQGEQDEQEAEQPLTVEKFVRGCETLRTDEDTPTLDFMQKSSQISGSFMTLRTQITNERDEILRERMETSTQKDLTERRLGEIGERKGLRKLITTLEGRKLRKGLNSLQAQIEELDRRAGELADEDQRIISSFSPIEKRRGDTVKQEVENAYRAMHQEFVSFYTQALEDDDVIGEVREAFVSEYLDPEVAKLDVDQAKKDDFYSTLQGVLSSKDPNSDEAVALRKRLDSFLTYDGGFRELSFDAERLINGNDKLVVRSLISHIIAGEAVEITDKLSENPNLAAVDLHRLRRKIMNPASQNWGRERDGDISFSKIDFEQSPSSEFINVWKVVKETPQLKATFQEEINEIDNEFYRTILEGSLTDRQGNYIDSLKYYPTPESIRNLIILAAADKSEYRTVHANWSLSYLAKRSDWEKILDEAQEKYPSLQKAREVLSEWNYNEYWNQPNIRQDAEDLSLTIFQDPTAEPRLKELAAEALTNGAMLKTLVARDLITNEDLSHLINSGTKLEDIEKISRQEEQEDYSHISEYYFGRSIRTNSQVLLREDLTVKQKELFKIRLQRLALLGREISLNNDPRMLSYLSSDTLVNLFQSSKVEGRPEEFLSSMRTLLEKGFPPSDENSDLILGETLFDGEIDKTSPSIKLVGSLLGNKAKEIISTHLVENENLTLNEDNWNTMLGAYVLAKVQNVDLFYFSEEERKFITSSVELPENRDFCLSSLSSVWLKYLRSEKKGNLPLSLVAVPELIETLGTAGPLSQLESLSKFIVSVNKANMSESTSERTRGELFDGLRRIEERFQKEKWSEEDKTEFYNISSDILNTAPSLYSEFFNTFEKLNPSQLKRFTKELYPLYRAQIVLMEEKDKDGNKKFDPRRLVELRGEVKSFNSSVELDEKPFEKQRVVILEKIGKIFKEKFGITQIPANFSQEHMRSFADATTYLANLHGRNEDRESILGFYLALTLNEKWESFRRGEEIDPNDYLTSEKADPVKTTLELRKRLNPLTAENLGLREEELPEFCKVLQHETQNLTLGSVETVDVKLNNVILNLRTLEDPDLYPEQIDKQRLRLLQKWGNKRVGSVAARMYQEITNPSRKFQFTEEEEQVKQEIGEILSSNGLNSDADSIKTHFQDGIRPLATVVNLLRFVDETGAENEISSLRQDLRPSADIITIFSRLGEDFTPASGAMAFSQDLTYLENLVVKREEELTENETLVLREYIKNIRGRVVKLEETYSKIKEKFESLKSGSLTTNNQLLANKLIDIDKIISAPNTQQGITSTMTNDLNTIIENMRECLSCTKDGSNNDTNLTFGDMNKFYLYSNVEGQTKGSISDQIVFLEPITRTDGSQEMAFVLDKTYGTSTPTILENQAATVIKKIREIKQKFPHIKISAFITSAATTSGGTSAELLIQNLKEKGLAVSEEELEVNVQESAFGEHYIEFGGGARQAGKRSVTGITIKI